MERLYFQSLSWYYAIPLNERTISLLSQGEALEKFDAKLAEQRMQRWRSQAPFKADAYFAERLVMEGLTEEKFLYLLGEPIGALQGRFPNPPYWLEKLAQAFSSFEFEGKAVLSSKLQSAQESLGLLYAIEPLIHQGLARLHQGVQALGRMYPSLPFDPNTVGVVLFATLQGRLLQMLVRTLTLELNVARLQGLLEGNTPEERFHSFLKRLRQREVAIALLREYPVLARQVTLCIDQWVKFSLEFLQHLCVDWKEICTTFNPNQDLGVLTQVEGAAGDSHRGGKAVLIAEFSSGFRIVYKPRSLAVDVHFQELLAWLNDRGDHPPFQTIKILARSTYGWSEYVTSQSCTSTVEVQHFYERLGGYLMLLHALAATDFHYENLIAAGAHPVLVDLETLFDNFWVGEDGWQSNPSNATNPIYSSILRTGLLPRRIRLDDQSGGIDLSGLAAKEGQPTPYRFLVCQGIGTDEMKLTRQQGATPGRQNRPTLNSAEVNLLDYTEAIVAGFTKVYRLLLQHRDEFMSNGGPLARFAEDEVRVVFRPSRTYGLLLRESYHPDVLRNALDRERLFDHLWVAVQYNVHMKRLISAEREDLWRGDIPKFTTRPSSCHLWSSTNKQIKDLFDEPSMALVQRRIQQLSEKDLARQLWFIRASLKTLVTDADQRKWSGYALKEPQRPAACEQVLAASRMIGERLETLMLRAGQQDVSWMGVTLVNERCWSLAPLGTDLYSGVPGIALFLGYLGEVTQDARYTTLAQSALITVRRQIEFSRSRITSIGAFSGWGGIIYTLNHLGVLWNQPELLAAAESFVNLLPALIEKDEQIDIMSGAAGCIGSLLNLYRCRSSPRILAVAAQCGEHLIARAQPMAQGKGWVFKAACDKPLTGFSHGAAGIAWALLELAALTGEERFRQVALEAINYERSLFSPTAGNWPDLREFETAVRTSSNDRVNCMTAWCHGAPGIGLARLCSLPYLDDAEIRAEIDTALNTTLKQGFGYNHSLCHGDLGNLEFLLQASQTLDDPQWASQVNRLTAIILESIEQHGWLCGVPLGVEVPGLMTGLAGIGYQLLRLAEPTRIPSVLALATPTPF